MRGSMIRHNSRVESIIHQYFYQPGSTMRRFPKFHFLNKNNTELRNKLKTVLLAERKRIKEWDKGGVIPFPNLKELLFPGW